MGIKPHAEARKRPICAHEAADARQKRLVINGFDQEIVSPGLKRRNAGRRALTGGQHHNRHASGLRIGAQLAQNFGPGHVGQITVQKDEGGGLRFGQGEAAGPIRRHDGQIAGRGQLDLHDDAIGRHIIDDENFAAHCLLSSSA